MAGGSRENRVFKAMNRPLTIFGSGKTIVFCRSGFGRRGFFADPQPSGRHSVFCRGGDCRAASHQVRRRDPESATQFKQVQETL